jgi:hypothetical protein
MVGIGFVSVPSGSGCHLLPWGSFCTFSDRPMPITPHTQIKMGVKSFILFVPLTRDFSLYPNLRDKGRHLYILRA